MFYINDALNTFYLRLYGVGHMVKDHSDSERGNPLLPHGLLFPINSKGSFICTIPQTGYLDNDVGNPLLLVILAARDLLLPKAIASYVFIFVLYQLTENVPCILERDVAP